ncbi:MAG: endonuclease III [Lachnospiraceae bacterium]|nr:endonuclease III [Lachnospiraceae bacterium]
MTNKEKAKKIVRILIKRYGAEMPLYLYYHKNKPYEFLFAVMMSAQCTDERVNLVTKGLYKKYDSLHKFANANIKTLENDIFSVGFYHNKAKNLIACARKLIIDFGEKVPRDFDDLLSLPGVGRKTASVVVGTLYNEPAMAVDTHVARISNILFKLSTKDVGVIEEKLKEIVEKRYWNLWNTHIIALGREICVARRPKCDICPLYNICKDKL